MVPQVELRGWVRTLERLLERKCGSGAGSLSERLRVAGRKVPSSLRRDIRTVIAAEANPRSADPAMTRAAFERAEKGLRAVVVKEKASRGKAGRFGSPVMNLALLIGIFAALLAWKGAF